MNFFSTKIGNAEALNLKQALSSVDFEFSDVQNGLWKATGKNVFVTYYKSQKLLIQGKGCDEFVSKYLGHKTVSEQQKLFAIQETKSENIIHDFSSWIGTDESGKGDYIGPLVIAGVMVKKEQVELLTSLDIKDSKKMTDKYILQVATKIKQNCVFSVVTINPEKYNQLYSKFKNLNKLLAWGHGRVIENILLKCPGCQNAISDKFGDESLIKNALQQKGRKINLVQRTKAESDIAVACASVLAREEFLKRTETLHSIYGMEFSKGGGEIPTNQAKEFCEKYGRDKLHLIAKMHFKNTARI